MQNNQREITKNPDLITSSDKYAERFDCPIGKYFLDVQTKTTLELLKMYKINNILDVGGGHAQLAVPLIKNGFDITVVGSDDLCRARLDKLLNPNSFIYHTCDLLNMPFKNRDFDVVLAYRIITHIGNWQRLIAELCRVSKNCVIIDFPQKYGFNIFYNMLYGVKIKIEGNLRPLKLFSRKEVELEFKKHEFGKPLFKPQFFIPMVVHRIVKSVPISKTIEFFFSSMGLTNLLGSPVIMRVTKL